MDEKIGRTPSLEEVSLVVIIAQCKIVVA